MGLQFEEHDLKHAIPEYEEYRHEVPMLIPGTKIHHHHEHKGHHGIPTH
jgi:hypothetical protein